VAIEPKTPRKRAVKKASAKADAPVTEVAEEKKTTRKKAAAIPVPIFQAAPEKPAAKERVQIASLVRRLLRRKKQSRLKKACSSR
jgi:hypothetical protein